MKTNSQDIANQTKQVQNNSTRNSQRQQQSLPSTPHKSQPKLLNPHPRQFKIQIQKKANQSEHSQSELTKSRISIISSSNNNYYNIHPCSACGIDFNTNGNHISSIHSCSSSKISNNSPNGNNHSSNHNHNSYTNSNMSAVVAHCQQVHAMQLEFQSVVRGYEIRIKNTNQQFKRSKQQMENKIKQLFKQKNYWSNIANTLIQQNNRMGIQTPNLFLVRSSSTNSSYDPSQSTVNKNNQSRNDSPVVTKKQINAQMTTSFILQSPQITETNQNIGYQSSQYSSTSQTDRVLLSQFAKLRRKLDEVEKQNIKVREQKVEAEKIIQKTNAQSHSLKVKVTQYLKIIYKSQQSYHALEQQLKKIKNQLIFYQNQYTRLKSSLNGPQSSTSSSSSSSHKSRKRNLQPSRSPQRNTLSSNNFIDINQNLTICINQVEALKLTNQKYRLLISNLTEDAVLYNMGKLNQKYAQSLSGAYGVSRGGFTSNYSSLGSMVVDSSKNRRASQHNVNI